MKKVKKLNVAPTSLQRFLQYFPQTSRHISDWAAFRNENGGETFRELISKSRVGRSEAETHHLNSGTISHCGGGFRFTLPTLRY